MAIKNNLYPHLLQESIDLWEAFLPDHRDEYQGFDYDVRVGDGRDPGPNFAPNMREMALKLSARRIDVVGHHHDRIDIIEITPYAGVKAIGQLTVYPVLYNYSYKPQKRLQPVLITHDISPDIADSLSLLSVIVYKIT